MIAFYTTEDGHYVGGSKGAKNIYQTLHTLWKQLYQEGRISKVKTAFKIISPVLSLRRIIRRGF